MLFWIFCLFFLLALLMVFSPIFIDDVDYSAFMLLIGFVFFFVFGIIIVATWSSYSTVYSKVVAQGQVIEVQKERIASLEKRLEKFNYPEKSTVNMDGDSPWASIVKSLSEAEEKLAKAKSERAEAIRDVQSYKVGPFSGVVTLVGDPTEE